MSEFVTNGIVYDLNKTSKTGIVKFASSNIQDANILSIVDGCIIDEIGAKAFYYCDKMKTVNIPSTIERIKNDAFCGCRNLKKINKNNSIDASILGRRVFKGCINLGLLNLRNAKIIGESTFEDCTNLRDVFLSCSEFEIIENNLFKNCSSLNRMVLEENVRIIKRAFEGCSSLTMLTIKNKKVPIETFIIDIDKNVMLMGYENSTIQEMLLYGFNFQILKN